LTPIPTFRMLAALAAVTLACHCGSSSTPAPNTIAISNFQYVPANLSVAPGTTVTVTNSDSMQHSVTSESVTNAFTPGDVSGVHFDTGAFTTSGTFVIPSTATVGTVIPYYCTVHVQTMGQGQITVVAP
jgi:plastocyanin